MRYIDHITILMDSNTPNCKTKRLKESLAYLDRSFTFTIGNGLHIAQKVRRQMIHIAPKDRWPNLFSHKLGEAITAPLWGENEGGGRFYMPGRIWIPTTTKLDHMKAAGVTHVEAHDTDILDLILGPDGANGYPVDMSEKEKMNLLRQAAAKFAKELEKRGLKPGMFTMNLFSSDPLFIFGNLGSQNEKTRALAISRMKVGMEIAQEVLHCIYVYWNGTNGVDGVISANHMLRNELTYQALVTILKWARRKWGDLTQPIACEAKVEEPKHKMYTPVTQCFLAMAWRMACEHPSLAGLMGVNPEVGHIVMAKLDPAMTFGEALFHGLLYHTHLNDQGGDPAFDRDHPVGATNLKSLIDIMYQLRAGGYSGLIGIDAQPRPTDRDDQQAATIETSVARIKWAVAASEKLDTDEMRALQAAHDQDGIDRLVDTTVFGIEFP